jgi:hypothetical protein
MTIITLIIMEMPKNIKRVILFLLSIYFIIYPMPQF